MRSSIVATILIILGATAFAIGGYRVSGDVGRAGELGGRIEAMQTERDSVRTVLFETNLLRRGHKESLSNLPDSTRQQQGGIILERMKQYNKSLEKLERANNELLRKIKLDRKRRDEVVGSIKSTMLPFGAGGLFAVLLGVVIAVRGRRG